MLHLIFQSTPDKPLLQRVGENDALVFLESAVFCLIKGSALSDELQQISQRNIQLYTLSSDIKTRGIDPTEMVKDIHIIDYSGLVKLTEDNKVIHTWS